MNFRKYLNEMYVKEQNKIYFIIPANILRVTNNINDYDDKYIIARYFNITEVLECINYMLDQYVECGNGFSISERLDNFYALKKLGIKFNVNDFKKKLIPKCLKLLTKQDFVETQCKTDSEGVVYIFKFKNFSQRFPEFNYDNSLGKHMYIKFNFIYSYDIIQTDEITKDGKPKVIKKFYTPSIRKTNKGDTYILIEPELMTLYDISFHGDK